MRNVTKSPLNCDPCKNTVQPTIIFNPHTVILTPLIRHDTENLRNVDQLIFIRQNVIGTGFTREN